MKSGNASNYFNINPPGSSDVAMFIGSTSCGRFQAFCQPMAIPAAKDS